MSSSSLANWDGSQTAKKQQETVRDPQLGNATFSASIALAITSPGGNKVADMSLAKENASYHQFEHDGRNRDQVYGDSGATGAFEARVSNNQKSPTNVEITLDEDIIMLSPSSASRTTNDVYSLNKRSEVEAETIRNGYDKQNQRSMAAAGTDQTHSNPTSPPSKAKNLEDASQIGRSHRPVTPTKPLQSSSFSPPIFASPEHRLRITGPSRKGTPLSPTISNFGSLFTPAVSRNPSPAPSFRPPTPPRRSTIPKNRAYVDVPPFPPGLSKLSYDLLPRKRKTTSYYKPEDVLYIQEPKKARAKDPDYTARVSIRNSGSSPSKTSGRRPGRPPKAKASTQISVESASVLAKTSKAKTTGKPPARKPGRPPKAKPTIQAPSESPSVSIEPSSDVQAQETRQPLLDQQPLESFKPSGPGKQSVYIMPVASRKTIENMHAFQFVHIRFIREALCNRNTVALDPSMRARPLAQDNLQPCWDKWQTDGDSNFEPDQMSLGTWEDEVDDEDEAEADDDVFNADSHHMDLLPTATQSNRQPTPIKIEEPQSVSISWQSRSSEPPMVSLSGEHASIPYNSPPRPNVVHTPTTNTPERPSAKALVKKKAVEAPQDISPQNPTFTIPSQQSPTITPNLTQESPYGRGASQYFNDVFDSPSTPAFKHGQSSELNLASHSNSEYGDMITGTPSAESELFSSNAGLSQSHSTTLTSTHDDMLSRSGIDTLDTTSWDSPMPIDQIPFGDGTINPSLLGRYNPLDDFGDQPATAKSPSSSRSSHSSPSTHRSAARSTPSLSPSRSPSPSQRASPSSTQSQVDEDASSVSEPPVSPALRPQRAHHAPSRLPRVVTQRHSISDEEEDVPLSDLAATPPPPPPPKPPRVKPPKIVNKTPKPKITDWPQQHTPDYCHQCRTKNTILKLDCSSDSCTRKYCYRCLSRWYDEDDLIPEVGEDFTCPVCRGTCTCDVCTKKRGEVYVSRRVISNKEKAAPLSDLVAAQVKPPPPKPLLVAAQVKPPPPKPPPAKTPQNIERNLRFQGGDWPRQAESEYCHQCRSKSNVLKVVCSSDTCLKKYCYRCLTSRYAEDAHIIPEAGEDFNCPSCRGTCTCDKCTTRRGEVYVRVRINGKKGKPPGIRTEDLPKLRTRPSHDEHEEQDEEQDEGEEEENTLPPVTTFNGPIEYFGAVYDMSGNKVGATFSGTNTELVLFQPFCEENVPPTPAKRTTRIFIGEIQDCWRLEEDCVVQDYDPLPSGNRNVGPKRRLYIGDKRLLYKPRGPAAPQNNPVEAGTQSQDWSFFSMDSPLTDLDELDEPNNGDSDDRAGELRQPSFDMQSPDSGLVSQWDHEQTMESGSDVPPSLPLSDEDIARAIALGLKAWGLDIQVGL